SLIEEQDLVHLTIEVAVGLLAYGPGVGAVEPHHVPPPVLVQVRLAADQHHARHRGLADPLVDLAYVRLGVPGRAELGPPPVLTAGITLGGGVGAAIVRGPCQPGGARVGALLGRFDGRRAAAARSDHHPDHQAAHTMLEFVHHGVPPSGPASAPTVPPSPTPP